MKPAQQIEVTQPDSCSASEVQRLIDRHTARFKAADTPALSALAHQIDAESFAERLVDSLMSGQSIPSDVGPLTLWDALGDELIYADELAKLFNAPRAERLTLLDDLEAKSRKVVSRFVAARRSRSRGIRGNYLRIHQRMGRHA